MYLFISYFYLAKAQNEVWATNKSQSEVYASKAISMEQKGNEKFLRTVAKFTWTYQGFEN